MPASEHETPPAPSLPETPLPAGTRRRRPGPQKPGPPYLLIAVAVLAVAGLLWGVSRSRQSRDEAHLDAVVRFADAAPESHLDEQAAWQSLPDGYEAVLGEEVRTTVGMCTAIGLQGTSSIRLSIDSSVRLQSVSENTVSLRLIGGRVWLDVDQGQRVKIATPVGELSVSEGAAEIRIDRKRVEMVAWRGTVVLAGKPVKPIAPGHRLVFEEGKPPVLKSAPPKMDVWQAWNLRVDSSLIAVDPLPGLLESSRVASAARPPNDGPGSVALTAAPAGDPAAPPAYDPDHVPPAGEGPYPPSAGGRPQPPSAGGRPQPPSAGGRPQPPPSGRRPHPAQPHPTAAPVAATPAQRQSGGEAASGGGEPRATPASNGEGGRQGGQRSHGGSRSDNGAPYTAQAPTDWKESGRVEGLVGDDWMEKNTRYSHVYARKGDLKYLGEVVDLLDPSYEVNLDFMGVTPSKRLVFYFFPLESPAHLQPGLKVTRTRFAGLARSDGTILVNLGNWRDSSHFEPWYVEEICRHEMNHQFARGVTGRDRTNTWHWFLEALAHTVEDTVKPASSRVTASDIKTYMQGYKSQDASWQSLIADRDNDSLEQYRDYRQILMSVIFFLQQKYGSDVVKQLMQAAGQGIDIEDAFIKVTGKGTHDLEAEWKSYYGIR